MKIRIIRLPYDSGHRSLRMGRGPEHLIQQGLPRELQDLGHQVELDLIETRVPFPSEIGTAFDLYRQLSKRVSSAFNLGLFPLVLSGNCGSALGTISGIPLPSLGVVWFDGHGEFNTPDTTASGFLDGMPLATLAGRCWKTLAQSIPQFRVMAEQDVVLVGVRSYDPLEEQALQASQVTRVGSECVRTRGVRDALGPALDALRSRTESIYLHLDPDALEPAQALANSFVPPGGLTVEDIRASIEITRERFTIIAAAVASYDPDCDSGPRTCRAVMDLIKEIFR
jgi:arginase